MSDIIERLRAAADVTEEPGEFAKAWQPAPEMLREAAAEIERLREALVQAEACMTIVEPRSDKAEYLRILGVVRAAISGKEETPRDADTLESALAWFDDQLDALSGKDESYERAQVRNQFATDDPLAGKGET